MMRPFKNDDADRLFGFLAIAIAGFSFWAIVLLFLQIVRM